MILLLYKHPNFPAHLYSILLSLIRRGTFSGVVKQSHISYIVIVVPGYKKQSPGKVLFLLATLGNYSDGFSSIIDRSTSSTRDFVPAARPLMFAI